MDKLVLKAGEVLKRGDKDPRVKIIQTILVMPNPIESFGPQTEKAVMAFQTLMALTVDGKVGPATALALQAFADANAAKGVAAGTPGSVVMPGITDMALGTTPAETFDAGEEGLTAKPLDTNLMLAIGLGAAGVVVIGAALWFGRKPHLTQRVAEA